MTKNPQDDLTAERAAKFLKQHFTELLRDDGEPWVGDVELIQDLIKTARQETLREAAKVANYYNCTHNHGKKATQACDDIIEQLDRLASEGAVDASQAQ